MRRSALDELAKRSEVHIHQRRKTYIRRLCVEDGQTYLGRSDGCLETETEGIARSLIGRQRSAEGVVPASERWASHSFERRETASAQRVRDNREGPNGPRKGLNRAASKD
jgi:hypothetical protein